MASRAADMNIAGLPQAEAPHRVWWTAGELAELALPGLPGDKRSINRRAQEERWTMRTGADGALLVRPRAGRGGGVEYHLSLLPPAARLELARRGLTGERPTPMPVADDIGGWRWYEAQAGKVHAEAERRLRIVSEIELLEQAGMTRTAAVAEASARHGVAKATLWNWLRLVDGVAAQNRLPALAPRRKGGGCEAAIDPFLWTYFKSDCLRPSGQSLASCYERTADKAREMGLSLPSERTMRRRLEAEVDPRIMKLLREGEEALRRSLPAQRRTVEHLHALEIVNLDGHLFDVRVTPPDGGAPVRPMGIFIQDVRSSMMLAWRLALSENACSTRLAFADVFRKYGIPRSAVMDNGRAFNSKWLTGGAPFRFRGKIKDSDPTGLLVALGIEVHPTIPYRGQSKPIERAFGDLINRIARAPECDGAYTGSDPTKKPHNYGTRAMAWDDFERHVAIQVARHNAKLGRRGRDYNGRSFEQVFAATWSDSVIRKATDEDLRKALLTAEQVRVNAQTGEIALFGNRYWSEECGRLHGQRVTVRFDPEQLKGEVYLYDQAGVFLTAAQLIADTGFDDVAGAKATAKRWADYRRRIRDAAEAEQLLAAEELAAMQAAPAVPIDLPEPAAIRPIRHRGQVAAALNPAPQIATSRDRENRIFGALRLIEGGE
ncbi:MAG: transposase domain-containing protein [Pseudomonadota bacterium]